MVFHRILFSVILSFLAVAAPALASSSAPAVTWVGGTRGSAKPSMAGALYGFMASIAGEVIGAPQYGIAPNSEGGYTITYRGIGDQISCRSVHLHQPDGKWICVASEGRIDGILAKKLTQQLISRLGNGYDVGFEYRAGSNQVSLSGEMDGQIQSILCKFSGTETKVNSAVCYLE